MAMLTLSVNLSPLT